MRQYTAQNHQQPSGGPGGNVAILDESANARPHPKNALNLNHQLLDLLTDAVFIHDLAGNLTYVNQSACNTLGYTRQELLSLNLKQLEDLSCGSSIIYEINNLPDTGCSAYASAYVCKNGVVVPVEMRSSLVKSDGYNLVLSVARDTTESNLIQQHIRELEDKYGTLFENTPIGLIEWDFTKTKIYIENLRSQGVKDFKKYFKQNPGAVDNCVMLIAELRRNRTARMMFGTPENQLLDPPSINKLVILLLLMLIQGRTYLTEEQRVKTNDGAIKYYLKGCYIPPSCKGTWARVLVIDTDVTAIKETQNDLRRSEARTKMLAHKVIASQEEERARIARELHDVVAQSLVDVRRKALALSADVDQTKFSKSQSDLVKSIDDVYDWVHNLTVELRPLMLDELGLIKASQWYTEQIELSSGITCRVKSNLGMEQASIIGKEVAIVAYRIMQEAVLNAIRHAKATKITITISIVKKNLRFCISDDGIGITAPQLDNQASLGLLGMKERATTVRGTLRIFNNQEGGVNVVALLPLAV